MSCQLQTRLTDTSQEVDYACPHVPPPPYVMLMILIYTQCYTHIQSFALFLRGSSMDSMLRASVPLDLLLGSTNQQLTLGGHAISPARTVGWR